MKEVVGVRTFSDLTLLCLGAAAGVVALFVSLFALGSDLPWSAQSDEPIYVLRAARILATGDWNPRWFGNPGSILIYLLVVVYHGWLVVAHGAPFLQAFPELLQTFPERYIDFYFIGDLVGVVFLVGSVWLTYLLGKRVGGGCVGVMSAWLLTLLPLLAAYTPVVRTDVPAMFFAAAILLALVHYWDRITVRRALVVGALIGFAVATRYFMIAFVPLVVVWWMATDSGSWRPLVAATIASAATFAVTTPYFFLDIVYVLWGLYFESRNVHPGADGLGFLGNVWWYVSIGVPQTIGWVATLFMVVGGVLAVTRTHRSSRLLLLSIGIFILVISLPGLHWQRWLIPLLPALVVLVAHGILLLSRALTTGRAPLIASGVGFVFFVITLLPIAVNLLHYKMARSVPSTRVAVAEWVVHSLPPTTVLVDFYTLPFSTNHLHTVVKKELGGVPDLETLRAQGLTHVIVNGSTRQVAKKSSSSRELSQFYDRVAKETVLIKVFYPSTPCPLPFDDPVTNCGSPVIEVYQLQ